MAALTELGKSRRVVATNDSLRVYLTFFGPKADFAKGANGWTYTVGAAPSGTVSPTIGTLLSGLAVTLAVGGGSAMSFSGYETPVCTHVDLDPRWTKANGYVRLVFEGVATWVD